MAYSALPSVSTGDLWTAANHNTYLRDNLSDHETRILAAESDIDGLQLHGLYYIDRTVLSGSTDSVTFTGLTGYSQIEIAATLRGDYGTGYTAYANMRINGDTGSNYNYMAITNNHSTTVPTYTPNLGVDEIQLSFMPVLNSDANYASVIKIAIPHANNTTFYKNVLIHSASNYKSTDGNFTEEYSAGGQWKNTDAVSSITFYPSNGNFIAGCIIDVYGIK